MHTYSNRRFMQQQANVTEPMDSYMKIMFNTMLSSILFYTYIVICVYGFRMRELCFSFGVCVCVCFIRTQWVSWCFVHRCDELCKRYSNNTHTHHKLSQTHFQKYYLQKRHLSGKSLDFCWEPVDVFCQIKIRTTNLIDEYCTICIHTHTYTHRWAQWTKCPFVFPCYCFKIGVEINRLLPCLGAYRNPHLLTSHSTFKRKKAHLHDPIQKIYARRFK